MTPLEWHGIDHLSAASLNLWMANPREWALRYLAKEVEEPDPAMWRGSAVEAGLACLLRGRSLEEARTAAADSFELNAVGELSEEVDAERSLVLPMLHRASTWIPPGELTATQLRIEHWLDDVPVPLVGYLDFAFVAGIDIDLKTTRACPSKPRGNHVRQVALYRAARGRRGGLLYVTDRKLAYFEIDDIDAQAALDDLRDAALSLSQFLAKVRGADDALACLPYNPDDFRTTLKDKDSAGNLLLAG
jgi:PD-(D/E)XK nuclease superfamily